MYIYIRSFYVQLLSIYMWTTAKVSAYVCAHTRASAGIGGAAVRNVRPHRTPTKRVRRVARRRPKRAIPGSC